MHLYQAILAGAQLSTQGFGGGAMEGKNRCALGGALQVLGYAPGSMIDRGYNFLCDLYPHLTKQIRIIWYLNDKAKWSRERIAYWLKNFETKKVVELNAKIATEKESVCFLS